MFICVAGANAQTQQKSSHSAAHKRLLANQAKGKDQIRLVEKNSFIDLIDDIEPEPCYIQGDELFISFDGSGYRLRKQ